MNTWRDYTRFGKALLVAAVLSVLLLFAAVPRSLAHDRAECQQRIERSEARLNDAIRKHGGNSEQANDRRRDLNAERERCWNQHNAWWHSGEHQWHNERDWDRYDRDHDWDRDHDRDGDHGGYRSNPAYQTGYNDGLAYGRTDQRMGRKYQPAQYPAYKHGDQTYRGGFANGYNAGYGRGW